LAKMFLIDAMQHRARTHAHAVAPCAAHARVRSRGVTSDMARGGREREPIGKRTRQGRSWGGRRIVVYWIAPHPAEQVGRSEFRHAAREGRAVGASKGGANTHGRRRRGCAGFLRLVPASVSSEPVAPTVIPRVAIFIGVAGTGPRDMGQPQRRGEKRVGRDGERYTKSSTRRRLP